jgi:RND family efflux transporter MFP subunit
MSRSLLRFIAPTAALALAACGASEEMPEVGAAAAPPARTAVALDSTIPAVFPAAGVAAPVQQATLSTKLMAAVTEVTVREGDQVVRGQVLVRLDARDVEAKRGQVAASLEAAEAAQREAELMLNRMRALHADSAAPKAQLDAAEAGHARAQAAVVAARAATAEVDAMTEYSVLRSPFAGRVVRRFVDPGAFAAPGAPLVTIEDASRLRVSASAAPDIAAGLRRGAPVTVVIEGRRVPATVEGAVPGAGSLYTVNAVVANADRTLPSGGAATIELATGTRHAVLVPADAVIREGDLTGVRVVTEGGTALRWVRVGLERDGLVEILSGLRAGERVALPEPNRDG